MDVVDYQASMKLAEKKAAQKKAQQAARPIAERIDGNGKVAVWHVFEQKARKLWPVDAMHLIATGQAVLDKPEIQIEPVSEPEAPHIPKPKKGNSRH